MYGQRKGLAATGVKYDKVYEMLTDIYNRTKELAVTQEISIEKQNKILNIMESYFNEINSTYGNYELQ